MRWPRFTILQLFLVTALVGLLAGWWMQARQVGKQSLLTALAISPDGSKVAANYSSGSVDVWDISGSTPRQIRSFEKSSVLLNEVQFLDDGTIIRMRIDGQGTALVRYDPMTKRETVVLKSRTPWNMWCLSLDGKVAVSCGAPTTIDVWDLSTGKLSRQHTLALPAGAFVSQLELDARGSMIAASVPSQSQVHLIDVATGQKRVIASQMMHASRALSADGKSLVVVDWRPPPSRGPEIIVVDLTDPAGKPRCQFKSQMFLRGVRVSGDGSRLLLSSFERMAVWDLPPPKQRWQFDKAAAFQSWSMDFSILLDQGALSADGSRVVRSAGPGGILVLDATTGQRLMTIGGTNRLRDFFLYSAAFLGWAVAWGLVSRREKLQQPAPAPALAMPTLWRVSLTPRWAIVLWLAFILTLCGLLAWIINELAGDWLNVRPTWGSFLAICAATFFGFLALIYLRIRFWPLWGSLRLAQKIVRNTGRRQRQGKVSGLFAGESTIQNTLLNHVEDIRQKFAALLGRDVPIQNELLVIGLERAEDYYQLNRTRLPHGGIVMTHLFADECRVCEELAHRDGTTATVMLRATIALALLRRHWRVDAPPWLSAALSACLAADEQQPAALRRAHRLLGGILGDEGPAACHGLLSLPLTKRYEQIFQKDDPAVLRELALGQAIAISLGEYLLGDREGSPRGKMMEVLRSVGTRGNIDEAFQRVFGHSAAELAEPWWAWARQQPLEPWEPPPAEARWAIGQLARSIGPGTSLSPAEQQRHLAVLGSAGDLVAVPTLLAIIEDSESPLRAEALWALRGLSGKRWEDDPPRWRTWWQDVEPQIVPVSASFQPPPLAQWTGNPWSDEVVNAELATAIRSAENPNAEQPHEPWQLSIARLAIGAGGVWGIVYAVALSFYVGTISGTILLVPTLGFALLIGLLATARAAGRHWWGLRSCAGLQVAAIVGCDPVQALAGIVAAAMLRSGAVQRYLQRVGGS